MPRKKIAGNINLDQLRPLFPLELLTVHALDDTRVAYQDAAPSCKPGSKLRR